MSKLIVLYAGLFAAVLVVACSEDDANDTPTGSLEARLGADGGVDGGADGGADGGDGGVTTSD
jgi:hypothetical protein